MVLPPLVTGLSLLLLFGSQGWLSSLIPEISRWILARLVLWWRKVILPPQLCLRNARGFSVILMMAIGLPPIT